MPPAGRNRKTVLNSGPVIRFQEKGYPGNRFFPIDKKWVYVLGDKYQLVDELYLTQKSWRRMKRDFRGRRRDATDKTSILLKPGIYVPPSPTLYLGELFFYLSPIPLGQNAIKKLGKWSDSEYPTRLTVEEEFAKLAGLARSWSKVKGPEHAHRILWGYSTYFKATTQRPDPKTKPPTAFTTVRTAVNFDADGKRIKPGGGITKTPPWVHVVLLQDPEAWAEDIHEYGVSLALKLAQDYQNDPQHRKMRFIASSIATEIERCPEKNLESELVELPRGGGREAQPGEMLEVAKIIAQRVGWTLPTVKRATPTFARAGQPPVKPIHVIEVDKRLWVGACGYSDPQNKEWGDESVTVEKHPPTRTPRMKQYRRPENAAAFYLKLDDFVFTAYLENVERHLDELVTFMATPIHRLMCAEHAFATEDAPTAAKDDKLPDGERNTLRNSIRGMVHTCRLFSGLHLFLGGRKVIQELSRAPETETHANYYTLARGLFDGSQAFFTKKLWDNTVKRSIRSANLFVEATIGGILDRRFHAMVDRKGLEGINRIYVWTDRFYARMLGLAPPSPEEFRSWGAYVGRRPDRLPEYQRNALRRRVVDDMKKCARDIGQHESYMLEEKAKIYQRSRTTYAKVDAFLALIDALAAVDNLVERLRHRKAMDISAVRDLVYVSESVTKTMALVSSSKARAAAPAIGKAPAAGPPAVGKLIGFVGAYLDVVLTLDKVLEARNPKLVAGYLCQAVGASVSLAGTLWAHVTGVAISGPVGWVLAGAYLVGYVVGQVIVWIYSFEAWKKATAGSFLGKSKRPADALNDLGFVSDSVAAASTREVSRCFAPPSTVSRSSHPTGMPTTRCERGCGGDFRERSCLSGLPA